MKTNSLIHTSFALCVAKHNYLQYIDLSHTSHNSHYSKRDILSSVSGGMYRACYELINMSLSRVISIA